MVARLARTSRTSVRRHQAHRGAKPEGLPVEADVVHVEAEPASSPLPEPAPLAPPPGQVAMIATHRQDPQPAPVAPAAAAPTTEIISVVAPAPAALRGDYLRAGGGEPTPGKVLAFPDGRARPGRRCACCSSEHRQDIDAAIGAGMSYRGIERRYGVSDDSARHHATECVPDALARAADVRAAAEAQTVDTVLEEVTRLLTEARDALATATADGDASHKDRAIWFRELRQTVELLAKLRGELVTTTNNYL